MLTLPPAIIEGTPLIYHYYSEKKELQYTEESN